MTTETRIAYWFCQGDETTGYYSPNKPDEKWRVGQKRSLRGKIVPCLHGYHGSPTLWDALTYAPGSVACKVELSGTVIEHGNPVDKYAGRTKTLLAAVNIDRDLRLYAADCAEHVLWIYERDYPGDDRLRKVIETARDVAEGRVGAARDAAWVARDAAGAAWAAEAAEAAGAAWAAWAAGGAGAAWAVSWAAMAARDAAGDTRAAEQAWQREQFEVRFAHIFD